MLLAFMSILITSVHCFDFRNKWITPIFEVIGISDRHKVYKEHGVADDYRPYPGATWCEADSRLYNFDGRPLPSRHNHTMFKAFQSFCRKHHFYGKNHVQEDCYPFVAPPDLMGDRVTIKVEYKNADYLSPDKCMKELRLIHHTCFFGGKGLGLDHVEYQIIPRRGWCDHKYDGWDEDVPAPDHPTFGDNYELPKAQGKRFHA